MKQEGVICSHQICSDLSVSLNFPALTTVSEAEHETIGLENCKEKQAENRCEMLWSSKKNSKVVAHENWIHTDKKDEVQSQIMLAPPRQPGSDVRGGRSQPDTPGTTWGQSASLPRGRDRSRTQILAKESPLQLVSSLLRSKPHLCTGSSLVFGPFHSPPPHQVQEASGSWNHWLLDLVRRQLTIWWGIGRGETWEVLQHPREGNMQVQITNFHLEADTGTTPEEVLRASKHHTDSACAMAGLPPSKGDLNHSFLGSTPKNCNGTNTTCSTQELPWSVSTVMLPIF